MKKSIKQVIRLLVFLSIGSAILYYVYTIQSEQYLNYCIGQGNEAGDCGLLDKIWADVQNADLSWLLITIVLYMISNVSRAIRWKLLIEAEGGKIRTVNTFLATMIGYLSNLAIPRLGEFVRAGMLARYEKLDAAKVMGTVVTDRILDLLGLMVIFGLGLIFGSGLLLDYFQEHASLPAFSVISVAVLILIVATMAGAITLLYRRFRNHSIVNGIKLKLQQFGKGVMSIRKVKNFPALVIHSINIYLMYFLMTYLPFFSFEATSHLGPVAGLMVFIFGGLGMVLPSPGGMGTYHAMVIAALGLFSISGPDAFSFAMVIFITINICVNFLMGILSFILLPIINRHYKTSGNHVSNIHPK